MPRKTILIERKMILRYPAKLGKLTKQMIWVAFSQWQEYLYPLVVSECPVHKTPDPRRKPGFVRQHIKLVTRRTKDGSYKIIAVPGGTVQGTPAYHALSAIYSLHGAGGRSLEKPLLITPKEKKALAFPLPAKAIYGRKAAGLPETPKRRGPRNWVVVKWVFQYKWGKPNPFVTRVVNANRRMLFKFLRDNLLVARSRGRRKVIAVG